MIVSEVSARETEKLPLSILLKRIIPVIHQAQPALMPILIIATGKTGRNTLNINIKV